MELIEGLLGLILLAVLFSVGFGIILFPIYFDISFRNEYGGFPLSHGFAVAQLVGIMVAVGESSSKETWKMVLAVLFTIIVTIIAMVRTAGRVKSFGCNSSVTAVAVLAQMLIPVSVIILFIIISGFIDSLKKKDKK